MLDHIIMEANGVRMPLSRIAAVSVLDSLTLSVTPYDLNVMKEVERAIVSSPLSLNLTPEGKPFCGKSIVVFGPWAIEKKEDTMATLKFFLAIMMDPMTLWMGSLAIRGIVEPIVIEHNPITWKDT
eukprot:Gb_22384 [translate_table: standard]